MRRLAHPVALVVLGVFLLQAAWVLAVPPFRGSDEFDHVHRAAGVAFGQWRLTEPAVHGRGLLVWVPAETVEAARPQCAELEYPGPDNCFPVEETSDGRVLIATAAGGYNPVFYGFVGSAGLLGSGDASLYAMRVVAALLCLLCIGAGVATLRMWHTGPWALFGVVAGLSPTLLYSTAVVAPNGLEMAAALPVWLSLLGVRGQLATRDRDARLLYIATAFAPLLIVPRALGPLWFAAIGLTVMVWHGPLVMRRILRNCGRPFLYLVSVALLSGLGNIVWVLVAGGYAGETDRGGQAGVGVAFYFHLWSMQMVAAFPLRNEPTEIWIYPTVLVVVGLMVLAALSRRAGWRRRGLIVGLVLMFAIPMTLILITLQDRGGEYQGRYALPFVVGLLPLAGVILDKTEFAAREGARLRLIGVVMLGAAHAGSVAYLAAGELKHAISGVDPGWVHPPVWVLFAMGVLAWGCHAEALRVSRHVAT